MAGWPTCWVSKCSWTWPAARSASCAGETLVERLSAAGHELAGKAIVTDDVDAIRAQVLAWVADEGVDVILSTRGTALLRVT